MKILLTIAGHEGLCVRHVDIKTALLNGELSEEIYMKQPPGFEDKQHPSKVCKLVKSLYGLKQSARAWNKKLKEVLIELGFEQSQHDECLYAASGTNGKIYILIHVDDMMLISKSEQELLIVEDMISKKF